ncbi:RNA 2',3'-cyclic phosphodiesterase [Salinarimonas chemoclinalis]|uniref:RNA 2',3'-cyclic phosphodiesterase n=1 Tax=Salinarimonas chemoclinalis TaxID=3241599 RepID=UPI0035588B22
MPRLFVGLEIPEDVVATLAACRGGLPGARWVEPENYHVTLRFIGDVDEDVAEDVYALLAERRPRAPVEIVLDGLGCFGGDKPHAVFATVHASEALVALHDEAERLVRRAGLAPERRRFTPHVTLARLRRVPPRDVAAWIAARAPFERLAFSAERIAVFSAREQTGGGPYVVEAAYPLA